MLQICPDNRKRTGQSAFGLDTEVNRIIRINCLDGSSFDKEVSTDDTILSLKATIARVKSLAGISIELFHRESEESLADCIRLDDPYLSSVEHLFLLIQPQVTNRDSLVELYNTCNGPNWTFKKNWGSDEPLKDWYGVTVDDEGNVTRLNLAFNNLTGTIPLKLFGLTKLKNLSLWSNQLEGSIPSEIVFLSELQYLNLSGNNFSGRIPLHIGTLNDLEYCSLYSNKLKGVIPASIGNLMKLQVLHLGKNELCGPIPRQIVNVLALRTLVLSFNKFKGPIPEGLRRRPNIISFRDVLQGNRLTCGSVPFKV